MRGPAALTGTLQKQPERREPPGEKARQDGGCDVPGMRPARIAPHAGTISRSVVEQPGALTAEIFIGFQCASGFVGLLVDKLAAHQAPVSGSLACVAIVTSSASAREEVNTNEMPGRDTFVRDMRGLSDNAT
jgi:hypothetical protein